MTKLIGSASLTADKGTDLITKGDLHGFSTSNTRIPVGSNDQVLTADSGEALGVKWAGAGGVTTNSLVASLTQVVTTTSTSYVDITDLEITLSNQSGGIATIIAGNSLNSSTATTNLQVAVGDDGTANTNTMLQTQNSGGHYTAVTTALTMATNGSEITTMGKTESGNTMTFLWVDGDVTCFIMATEVY